jgi:S-formylglutathione hydrolase
MYSYVNEELPSIVQDHFHISKTHQSITGFSMGGLGALNISLRNPGKFKSISAFAPIAHPTIGKWGMKAFSKFLGSIENGKEWDPTMLMQNYNGPKTPLLVD